MKDLAHWIHQIIKENHQADDYELSIAYHSQYDARFAQNAISQHLSGENISIYYHASIDKKSASMSINQYDKAQIKDMIVKTEELAKINQTDPEYCPSIGQQEYLSVNNMAERTLNLSENEVIDLISRSISFAKEKNTTLSGIFTKVISKSFFFTKNGFEGSSDSCFFEYSMTMKSEGKETKISVCDKDFAHFNLDAELNHLYSQYSALDTITPMEPESIAVIFRPSATANLMMYLGWILDRRMADDGITPFKDQIGKQLFGKNFSLSTVIEDEQMIIYPYNGNCTIKAIDWIKDGVINALPMGKAYAQMIGEEAKQMFNISIAGGETSEAEMMKKVKRGLIVNNLWYIRPNDMRTADFTGMTRDGVLYFEDGEIKHSVNNFRFNEKLHEVTQRILCLGPSVAFSETLKAPTMLITDFNFVDKTNF